MGSEMCIRDSYIYSLFLFSVHMLAHMILSMAIPLLLVLGTPVTLAARAIEPRKDGSRGAREWILGAVNSRYLKVLGHPLVAAPLFGLSLIVFYYSPLFAWALEDHLGHVWMTAHFLLTGYLFNLVLLDADPHPHRPRYPLRLVVVLATMAFHAFFGLGFVSVSSFLLPLVAFTPRPRNQNGEQNRREFTKPPGDFSSLLLIGKRSKTPLPSGGAKPFGNQ